MSMELESRYQTIRQRVEYLHFGGNKAVSMKNFSPPCMKVGANGHHRCQLKLELA
ncbi:MAG: hypothetical protein F6J92_38345 [Symploca sp. SIO1A3]|nr:hypothetical protein [Symploca sp. SIO1A3]